jgi:hypothetical protein
MKCFIQSVPFIRQDDMAQWASWIVAISLETLPSMNSLHPIASWLTTARCIALDIGPRDAIGHVPRNRMYLMSQ